MSVFVFSVISVVSTFFLYDLSSFLYDPYLMFCISLPFTKLESQGHFLFSPHIQSISSTMYTPKKNLLYIHLTYIKDLFCARHY